MYSQQSHKYPGRGKQSKMKECENHLKVGPKWNIMCLLDCLKHLEEAEILISCNGP